MSIDANAQQIRRAVRQPMGSLRSPKLPAVIADVLRRRILTGELRQGDNLPLEQELVDQFGVSKPTVREALRVLEAESLIRPRRGSRGGAEVIAPSIDSAARYVGYLLQYRGTTLEDLARTRLMLEPPLAAQLAARISEPALAQLRGALDKEQAALDTPGEFQPADARFHELVCDLAGLDTMAIFVHQLNWVLTRLTEQVRETRGSNDRRHAARAHRAHLRMVELLTAGDIEAVQSFWHTHVAEVDKQLLHDREGQRVVDLFS